MVDLIATEKLLLKAHIKPGDTVVDFTMGNGHDTLWFSKLVGDTGRVYAFDVQPAAAESTEKLLKAEHAPENYTLILASHHNAENYVKPGIAAGIFNLGWLPGSDRSVTTMRDTTLTAVKSAIELLADGGGILIAVYPGHPEGRLEGEALETFLETFDRKQICVSKLKIINSQDSPYFFLIEKK